VKCRARKHGPAQEADGGAPVLQAATSEPVISLPPEENRLVANIVNRPSWSGIRVENSQTWILTDRLTDIDVGGVTYQHSSHGDHHQPWLLVDRERTKIGRPLFQLKQAAQAIEAKILKRAVIGG
jgi:hypothetical protein